MAGTLVLPHNHCWMPSGWVYDNVLERMATILRSSNQPLATMLLESRIEANGGYLDLEMSDADALRQLLKVADKAYLQFEAEGPSSFSQPESFPGFMQRFRELREILLIVIMDKGR
jgi:hypothetical protein